MIGRREQLAVLVVIAALVFGLGYKYALVKNRVDPPPAVQKAGETVVAEIRVHVAGAVESPGVYSLERGSRTEDAINLARATSEADINVLNLAAILQDGQRVWVPEKPKPAAEGEETGASARPGTGSDGKININTADAVQLATLPGIGPALADRIVRYRQDNGPFSMVEDLVNVSGIGEKTLEGLKDYATTY